jgi:hypothetical protein
MHGWQFARRRGPGAPIQSAAVTSMAISSGGTPWVDRLPRPGVTTSRMTRYSPGTRGVADTHSVTALPPGRAASGGTWLVAARGTGVPDVAAVAVAAAADRAHGVRLGQALGVLDREVLGGLNQSSQHRLLVRPIGARAGRRAPSAPVGTVRGLAAARGTGTVCHDSILQEMEPPSDPVRCRPGVQDGLGSPDPRIGAGHSVAAVLVGSGRMT